MPDPIQNNPKVFISYSHDSDEHKDRVLALSDCLRTDGINCTIDKDVDSPPEGWPQWMSNQIVGADFVLVVCTETYERRFRGKEETEEGLGAIWEGAIITQKLYEAKAKNTQIIPILLSNGNKSDIPIVLRSATYYRPDTDKGYKSLLNRLKNPLNKLKSNQNTYSLHITPKCIPLRNVPFQRTPYFTGRKEVLKQLHNTLKSDKTAVLAQAISGLGGIGKTQTVVEYTYQYRNEYEAVLWVKADTREALISDYAALAHVLDLPEKDAKEQTLAVAAVRHWLENNSGWLLVFDNADEPGLLEDYIPIDHKGHILLTSRAQLFDNLGISKPVQLEKMPPDEAKEFLLKRTGRSKLTQAEDEPLLKIAEELDYLPLALEQAGAYIKELKASFSNYLSSYRTRGMDIFKKHPPITGKYPESVATTWLLNFEEVERTSKASAELLTVSAFLHPDNIPLGLIIMGASEFGETITSAIEDIEKDPLVLDELLFPLTRFSLISRDVGTLTYSIHRLVQAVIRDRMDDDTQRLWAERTVRGVSCAIPHPYFSHWRFSDQMLSHAVVSAGLIEKYGFEFQEAALLLNQAGLFLDDHDRYTEAETMYIRALKIYEKSLGKDHSNVATLISNLATHYNVQGKYDESEPLYRHALEIKEKLIGKDHPEVATLFNNLATLYYEQGKYDDAELLYKCALEIKEKSFGRDHPSLTNPLNNLALLYDAQGKYNEAELLYRHAMEIAEKSLGKNHPNLAKSLNNIAELYRAQGKYTEAEPLYRRALEIFEKSLGKDHSYVAISLNNLALLYDALCKCNEAEPLHRRALGIWEKSLGKDHPNVATSLENLAALLRKTDREAEAQEMEERARGIRGMGKGN
ncbi:MAG: tetratricopeptide repeat protein [Methanobacteriota archaeon]